MNSTKSESIPLQAILLLFYVSGALALVYQVVWSRLMMHVFGSTALAVGTVLSAFMCGMAIGAWLFGKIADKSPNCFRLYAWLEIGIALAALISHTLLSNFAPVNLAIHDLFGSSMAMYGIFRFMLAFVLVMAPTILMGATLPVLIRFLVKQQTIIGVKLSTLYSVNTFGAVSGVLLTGFFLIGKFGIHTPVYMAVAGNLLIGGIAWLISRRVTDSTETALPVVEEPDQDSRSEFNSPGNGTIRLIVLGLGISGFTSFAYEIYWTRSLVFILGNSTYALTTMLAAFLTGIALGGYLIRFVLTRVKDRCALFGWIQVLLGITSALALPVLFAFGDPQALAQFVLNNYGQVYSTVFVRFVPAFGVMLIPAILIGATFPLVGQIGVRNLQEVGSGIGRIYAVNTLGNVLGALLPGVILLNWLGIQKGILAMAALNLTIGFIILFLRLMPASRNRIWRFALPVMLVTIVFSMSRAPIDFEFPSQGEFGYHQTLFYREGPLATTKVFQNPTTKIKDISIDGIVIGGNGSIEYKQFLLAHLPKLLKRNVSTELSVGLGSGILAGESSLHNRVRKITSVEIEPSVIEGASLFARENHNVLENPRSEIVLDDIGNFLRTTDDLYQVITADEKTAEDFASNGFSYSLEYYELLRRHLAPGGLVAQWVPAELSIKRFKMILKTFSHSFPHMQLWYFLPAHQFGLRNAILIGSNEPIPIDPDFMARQLADNPAAFRSLRPYGLTSAEAVLPHFVANEKFIRAAVEDAPLNSLVYPRFEFFVPWDDELKKGEKIRTTHKLMLQLKGLSDAEYFAGLAKNGQDNTRIRASLDSENSYLIAYQKYLKGISQQDMYRLFDQTLALAPWNGSLRAQIYAEYSYRALSGRSATERVNMMKRAESLYESQ